MCSGQRTTNYKWAQLDSNQRPISYEPTALTTELWALAERIVTYLVSGGKRQNELFVTTNRNIYRDKLTSRLQSVL
jgi:hypothetical protein